MVRLGVLAIVIATMIWGTTFVVVKGAVEQLAPSWLLVIRFGMSVVILLPWALGLGRRALVQGLELGFWLALVYGMQSVGLIWTTAGKSAFISALFVVFVPLILWFRGEAMTKKLLVCVGVALGGVGLLSFDSTKPSWGDLLMLGSALGYAIYMVRMEHHAKDSDVMVLTLSQALGVLLFGVLWLSLEVCVGRVELALPTHVPWGSVLYLGVFATALTTYLQTVGQKHVAPSKVAVLYMMEPLWAVVFGYVILGEVLGWQGVVGAVMILGATSLVVSGGEESVV